MGGSNTGKTNQVNTTEIHTAVNNQDLSNDIRINNVDNIRNYDIVHGNDIKGGQNTFNAILNTSTGQQIFKLMELKHHESRKDRKEREQREREEREERESEERELEE